MYSRLILLLPGNINNEAFHNFFHPDDYIIAVDGGIEHSTALNITPNLWIGDFDSCSTESHITFHGIPTEQFPTDKEYLDTELALTKACELNLDQCVMIGGIGGRLDHQMGLFMLLIAHPELHFIHTDGDTELYSLNHSTEIKIHNKNFKHISIIPITIIESASISGVKWPLEHANLKPGFGFSLSNEPTANNIQYSQKSGLGWIICSH